MGVTVSKVTVVENIYKNFYDIVSAISGFSTMVYPAFPNINLTTSSSYPIIILNSPEISWNQFTFGKSVLNGTISLDIFTTSAKTTDQYASDIQNGIEVEKDTLAGYGLRMVFLDSTTTDTILHGKIKIHIKTLTFSYKFYFDKTLAY